MKRGNRNAFYVKTLSMVVLAALATAGCTRSVAWLDRRDRSSPLMKRAQSRIAEGDYKSAIRLYQSALDSDPDLARAHLELGILYHDQEKDYVRAIHHYRRYQELRGESEKKEMIDGRIRKAGQMFAADLYSNEDPRAHDRMAMEKENDELKRKAELLRTELEDVRGKYDRLLAAVKESREQAQAQARGATTAPRVLPGRGDPLSGGKAATPGKITPATVRTYRVRSGDTLISIAAAMYQDSSQWTRIRDANRKILANSTNVKIGQVLVIP